MFGNAFDAMNQQSMNQQLQYLNQCQAMGLTQGIGQQTVFQPTPATPINPDDRLIVLLTEV